jgi:hypothetical protein
MLTGPKEDLEGFVEKFLLKIIWFCRIYGYFVSNGLFVCWMINLGFSFVVIVSNLF